MKRKPVIFIGAALILFSLGGTHANELSPQKQFERGNTAFEAGNLTQAFDIYQDLVRQGYSSQALYYNLGNLFYRRGERGKAILWYERAKRLTPRDSDVLFNLNLARSHIKKANESLLTRIILYFTPTELSWALAVFVWVFFLLLGGWILKWFTAEVWPSVSLWTSGILLGLVGVWFGASLYFHHQPWAIIQTPPGEVRNGPGTDYAVGFTIPEGSKVMILKKRPEWTQVGVPQEGLKGWMPTTELEEIQIKGRSSLRLG